MTERSEAPEQPKRVSVLDVILRPALVGVIVPLMMLGIALAIIRPGFYSPYTVQSVLVQAGIFTVVGLSQLATISIGQMNLALPAMAACSAMVSGAMLHLEQVPVFVAVLAGLAAGLCLGAIQGALIAFLDLNPFIITLGLGSLYLGALFTVIRGASFSNFNEPFAGLGSSTIAGIPAIALIATLCAVIAIFVYSRTVSGRQMLAVGANFRAARYSAIQVPWTVVKAHALSGILAGTAAILAIADLGTADSSLGQSWLLPSFAAPVLGGALLTGGRVSGLGTALGAVLLVLLSTGLVVVGVNQYWYQVGLGVVLLLSVLIGQARLRYATSRSSR